MSNRIRVPIQVKQSNGEPKQVANDATQPVADPKPPVVDHEAIASDTGGGGHSAPPRIKTSSREEEQKAMEALEEDREMWRDRAMRLQAEMENFRKRQRRLAQEHIEENRAQLLRNVLMVADDLHRALRAEQSSGSLREGVEVIERSLRHLLKQEGLERMEAEGKTFDPVWHEAVGTVPHREAGAERETVVEVEQPGYRLDGRLLRPARVIVAT